jgi:phospholipid/cholesterol/gamma-HCH transport system permease protein
MSDAHDVTAARRSLAEAADRSPSWQVETRAGKAIFVPAGDWTIRTIGALDADLRALVKPLRAGAFELDVSQLRDVDTSGAFLIDRVLRANDCGADPAVPMAGFHPSIGSLLAAARENRERCPLPPPRKPGLIAMIDRVGHGTVSAADEAIATLNFIGKAITVALAGLFKPRQMRWATVVRVMEDAGLDALPIVGMLAFFLGMVFAFIGANLLADFGAVVFTIDLVAFAMLREFGVLVAAILLAGRTASAFTAEIGSMKMRQEIDALEVLGLQPMHVLVGPRILAMLLMMPLLAVTATAFGLLGGMLVCWTTIASALCCSSNACSFTCRRSISGLALSKRPSSRW